MHDWLVIAVIVAAYVILTSWVLPKLGVST